MSETHKVVVDADGHFISTTQPIGEPRPFKFNPDGSITPNVEVEIEYRVTYGPGDEIERAWFWRRP